VNLKTSSFPLHPRAGRQGSGEFPASGGCWPASATQSQSSRRAFLRGAAWALAGAAFGTSRAWPASAPAPADLADGTLAFIWRCARDDGGYAPSPDPLYQGNSDTGLSDLAAVTYAVVLAKTMAWKLPHQDKSIQFIHRHQQKDGSFANLAGRMDPRSDLAVLYNTVQGVVALRALGQVPQNDPAPVMERFFVNGAYQKLPWYATSFFPLFYAALGKPFPKSYDKALRELQTASQTEDGYLGDHVAATFHLAHYFRLVGEPTPRAQQMVERVLRSQKPDGGFDIKEPDWDVHACFDAVFILRQLGGDKEAVRQAMDKAAQWVLRCRNADGGFGHFPGRPSDMDAVYFQFGTLLQTGFVPATRSDLPDAHLLSWGHAMQPGKIYRRSG
jgi:prenyltransferase beta subunit